MAMQNPASSDLMLPASRLPPLLPVAFCAVLFNRPDRAIVADCEQGIFAFAWNIAATKGGRREIRIWRLSFLAVLNKQSQPKIGFSQVLGNFIPATRGLRGVELQNLWCCSPDLVHDLDAAGQLKPKKPCCLPVHLWH